MPDCCPDPAVSKRRTLTRGWVATMPDVGGDVDALAVLAEVMRALAGQGTVSPSLRRSLVQEARRSGPRLG